MNDAQIEKELGLELTEKERLLEIWHHTFDERLHVSGDYEHALYEAANAVYVAKEPKRENYGECSCVIDNNCAGCEGYEEDHFWWRDSDPNIPRGF